MVCPPSRVALLNIGALLAELPLDSLQPEGDLLPAVQGAHPAPLHQTQGCVMMPCALCSMPCQTCLVSDSSQPVRLHVCCFRKLITMVGLGCALTAALTQTARCLVQSSLLQPPAIVPHGLCRILLCFHLMTQSFVWPACRLVVIGRPSPT